jgi:hypothetical protein
MVAHVRNGVQWLNCVCVKRSHDYVVLGPTPTVKVYWRGYKCRRCGAIELR